MSNEKRRDFIGNALETEEPAGRAAIDMHEKSIQDGVILALTLRVKDLLPEEKQIYVDHVCSTETGGVRRGGAEVQLQQTSERF